MKVLSLHSTPDNYIKVISAIYGTKQEVKLVFRCQIRSRAGLRSIPVHVNYFDKLCPTENNRGYKRTWF